MKVFKEFNQDTKCPLCLTNKRGKTVLIPIDGTAEGYTEEAIQVHLSCLNLRIATLRDGQDRHIIYQVHEGPIKFVE